MICYLTSELTKAEEFVVHVKRKMLAAEMSFEGSGFMSFVNNLDDFQFEEIVGTIRHSSARSKINDLPFPELGENGRAIVCELLFLDHVCGIHTSYWSRSFWIPKGDKFVKTFPTNAILDKFERGQRHAKDPVYR